ncbi:unnamed protein product, partial [Amoebophrya sp. A25]
LAATQWRDHARAQALLKACSRLFESGLGWMDGVAVRAGSQGGANGHQNSTTVGGNKITTGAKELQLPSSPNKNTAR